jgi:hypothetical protein
MAGCKDTGIEKFDRHCQGDKDWDGARSKGNLGKIIKPRWSA